MPVKGTNSRVTAAIFNIMAPTTQAATNSNISNAYNQGQQLQNMYNTQSTGAQSNYQNASNQANSAQGNLQDYTKQIAGQNFGNTYNQAYNSYLGQQGVSPTALLQAGQNLSNTQANLAGLPQAISQMGNYSGALAGQEAGNYSNTAGNLNQAIVSQTGQENAIQNVVANSGNLANQQTSQQLAGQQQALSGFQSSATNAASLMQNAGAVMNNIEQLQQQQGYLTSEQVAAYQNAYNGYISAQANATSASATQQLDAAQSAYYNQQVQEAKNSTGNTGTINIPGNNIQGIPLTSSNNSQRNSASILGSLQGGNYGSIQ